MRVSILGTGGIGLACAAWLAHGGHEVTVWSPGGQGAQALREAPLASTGILEAQVRVRVAESAQAAAQAGEVLLLAVPLNGHKAVMDALLPHLRDGQTVIVSSMGSLSSLYLYEAAQRAGRDITVAALGTTVLTARRAGPAEVRIMMRRAALGVSVLPQTRQNQALALCSALFGEVFSTHENMLATTLTNTNPVAHVPLALFNWTRIERAEPWPQYHYMTPQVSAVIKRLDAERLALARAFGLAVRSIEQHFAQSFGTTAPSLAQIAAELHAKRGGPPGPTDTHTRYLSEDVPFGLAFCAALGPLAGVDMPATQTLVATASLIAGLDFKALNDLIAPLDIEQCASAQNLLARVRG
ncbi:MAG: NAD/NADP octopine/nopaline dehydrogenase family protein [Comamonas sp.]